MTQRARPTPRWVGRGIAATGAVLVLATAGAQIANAGRSLSVDDNGQLVRVHASGEIITEAGKVSGTLPGAAKVSLDIGSESVTASFTIAVRGVGSIVGHASARLSSPGRYASFRGTLRVTGGTGRYAHARGEGKLYGAIERKSDNLTVQTREGTLYY
jgi:hypothetical protein